MGFHSIIYNTRGHTQPECSIFCLPGPIGERIHYVGTRVQFFNMLLRLSDYYTGFTESFGKTLGFPLEPVGPPKENLHCCCCSFTRIVCSNDCIAFLVLHDQCTVYMTIIPLPTHGQSPFFLLCHLAQGVGSAHLHFLLNLEYFVPNTGILFLVRQCLGHHFNF